MARYTQDSIQRLRESVDMLELVGGRTDLRRVGSRWVGLCPFHEERTPSFSVDGTQGLYHCFGCGAGGDAINFVRETESLDFAEAVELLSERYNVELHREQENPEEERRRRRRERLLALLERSTGFYDKYLWDAGEAGRAREYLAERGLSEEVLREFRVGYAPKAWDRLLMLAQRDGFKVDELAAAGLAQNTRSGGVVDRFRERIMFPLADARGRVLGFGARAMRDEQGAKYINTSENEIYHKGRQLFGIDRARQAAAKSERVVVVEGYTDVLALHQSGVREAVAIMGTALTEHQLSELARAAGTEGVVYLALDADSAGQQAMLRAASIAENRDVELRVVQMPDGVDPAELVAGEGSEAFLARLDGALSVLEFAVSRALAEGDLGSPDGRDRALGQAGALVASAPAQSARRDHLVRMVADRLDLPVDYVVSAVERGPSSPPPERGDPRPAQAVVPPRRNEPPVSGNPGSAALESERVFLALCLAGGSAGRDMLGEMAPEHFTSEGMVGARDHLVAHFDDPLANLDGADREVAMLVAGIALLAEESKPTVGSTLRMGFLQLELRRIEREVRRARQDGDLARQGELASARQRVRQDMDAVMGETV